MVLMQVTLDESSYEEVVEEKESQSYPGLYSKVGSSTDRSQLVVFAVVIAKLGQP